MKRAAISSDRLIVGASLAKAFGAPVAVLAGSAAVLNRYETHSATRVHCSPPSSAAIGAASRALAVNRWHGDALRSELAHNVSRFRHGLKRLGLAAIPGLFPVQPVKFPARIAGAIHDDLDKRGVEAVLQPDGISFVITARHRSENIDRALAHLAESLGQTGLKFKRS